MKNIFIIRLCLVVLILELLTFRYFQHKQTFHVVSCCVALGEAALYGVGGVSSQLSIRPPIPCESDVIGRETVKPLVPSSLSLHSSSSQSASDRSDPATADRIRLLSRGSAARRALRGKTAVWWPVTDRTQLGFIMPPSNALSMMRNLLPLLPLICLMMSQRCG